MKRLSVWIALRTAQGLPELLERVPRPWRRAGPVGSPAVPDWSNCPSFGSSMRTRADQGRQGPAPIGVL